MLTLEWYKAGPGPMLYFSSFSPQVLMRFGAWLLVVSVRVCGASGHLPTHLRVKGSAQGQNDPVRENRVQRPPSLSCFCPRAFPNSLPFYSLSGSCSKGTYSLTLPLSYIPGCRMFWLLLSGLPALQCLGSSPPRVMYSSMLNQLPRQPLKMQASACDG